MQYLVTSDWSDGYEQQATIDLFTDAYSLAVHLASGSLIGDTRVFAVSNELTDLLDDAISSRKAYSAQLRLNMNAVSRARVLKGRDEEEYLSNPQAKYKDTLLALKRSDAEANEIIEESKASILGIVEGVNSCA